jgi:hypothetical protein
VAFTWRPVWGVDLFFDGRKVGHSRVDRIGFGRHLRIPCDPADQTNEYLVDDLRVWKRVPEEFGAATDTVPPAAVTDLTVARAGGGKLLLSWTAPGDDGKKGRAHRYDVRVSTQPFGPVSWGGYDRTGDPLAAIHWAEADRIAYAPEPKVAGQLEKLAIGPLPKARRVYIALKSEDEANVSPLSNVVANQVNNPPVAHAGPSVRRVIVGTTVHFDARGSSDPDYDDLTYAWSNGIKGATGSLRYEEAGEHKVILTVSDGKKSATATTRLLVGDVVRVNFQPRSGAKTPEEFVPDFGEMYTKARGYGWRLTAEKPTAFARSKPTELPAEARTGLSMPRGAEWLFDLPDGTYTLTLATGDPAHLAGRPRIFIGEREAVNVDLAGMKAPHVLTDYKVTVRGGQLNLHTGVPLNLGGAETAGARLNYLVIQRTP